jgi:hypothetical protein
MCWIRIEEKMPPENTWVIGLCKLQADICKDNDPVVFQVKYQKDKGWSDWCGDIQKDTDWVVTAWLPLPSDKPVINLELMAKITEAMNGKGEFPPEYQRHLIDNFWSLL